MKIKKINLCKTSAYRRCSTSGLPWRQASGFSYADISISSVQSLSPVRLFVTPWTAAYQPSLCITNSWSLLKLMSIEFVMSSNHLILWHPLLFLPSIFPSIKVFSNESARCIRWPKYWRFSFSISPSNEYSVLNYQYECWEMDFALSIKTYLESKTSHEY